MTGEAEPGPAQVPAQSGGSLIRVVAFYVAISLALALGLTLLFSHMQHRQAYAVIKAESRFVEYVVRSPRLSTVELSGYNVRYAAGHIVERSCDIVNFLPALGVRFLLWVDGPGQFKLSVEPDGAGDGVVGALQTISDASPTPITGFLDASPPPEPCKDLPATMRFYGMPAGAAPIFGPGRIGGGIEHLTGGEIYLYGRRTGLDLDVSAWFKDPEGGPATGTSEEPGVYQVREEPFSIPPGASVYAYAPGNIESSWFSVKLKDWMTTMRGWAMLPAGADRFVIEVTTNADEIRINPESADIGNPSGSIFVIKVSLLDRLLYDPTLQLLFTCFMAAFSILLPLVSSTGQWLLPRWLSWRDRRRAFE